VDFPAATDYHGLMSDPSFQAIFDAAEKFFDEQSKRMREIMDAAFKNLKEDKESREVFNKIMSGKKEITWIRIRRG